MAIKGSLESIAAYSRWAAITPGATQYGPTANPPTEPIDAIYVITATTALTVTGSDGVSVNFGSVAAGTIVPFSPLAVTLITGGTAAALYR
jgi:hypothetical protein